MSQDFSWIKPGVKAIVVKPHVFPQLVGEIVTIKQFPYNFMSKEKEYLNYVQLEEGRELALLVGQEKGIINAHPSTLAPFDGNRDPRLYSNWEDITDIIGVDIRNIIEIIEG